MTAHLRLDADLAALRELGPWLELLLDGGDLPDGPGTLHGRLELALHEVCVNVVEHAYASGSGSIDLEGRVGPRAVELTVTDHGRAYDAGSARRSTPGDEVERGFGLGIAEQLVDDLTYQRDEQEGRNRWTLRVDR